MWVEKRQSSWIETVVLGGFALPHIWTRTLTVTVLSILATVLYEEVPQFHYSLTVAPFTIIGLPLGIFLGFRNNSAYDRFWEGRKLWGALVNTSRSFTRQILTLLDSPDGMEQLRDFQRETVHLLIAYVHALRLHLRDAKPGQVLDGSLPVEEHASHEGEHNVPLGILQTLAERLATARRKGWVHPQHVLVLEASLIGITDIQGACERIRSTPIPYSYTVLIHRIVAVYCMLLPFGLMETVKWATPAVVLAISYCFFGLDAVGDELEDPFGTQANERDLRRRLGEVVPGPIEPKRGVLT